MLPESLISSVEQKLSTRPAFEQMLGGGSINDAALVRCDQQRMVLKWNSAGLYRMFEVEESGLQLLRENKGILHVPEVAGTGLDEAEDLSWILMEYIPTGQGTKKAQQNFGRGLAIMHRSAAKNGRRAFGLEYDNYIGRLPQKNTTDQDWSSFFASQRIRPQLERAIQSGLMPSQCMDELERIIPKLSDIFPHEPPALLHGDLWGGNYLYTTDETAALIDPAVYYGHREMELAFTMMFGRFAGGFYDAYEEEWPLEPGFEQRKDLCNLYPVLVHVNLFGHGYTAQARSILKKYA
jgi:fructosamine-3-kinase